MKMKNKWDQLKKDWKLWKELKKEATGMGWDPVKCTIDSPEEWWAEKLQAFLSAKKFKSVGIDPVIEEKLDGMFIGVVATGTHAFTPNDICHVHTDVQSTSVPKYPRVEKKNKGVAFIKGTIDALVETCKARSSSSQDSSIDECLQVLNTYSDVKADDDDYIQYMKDSIGLQDCIGAIDGTHVDVRVCSDEKVPYIGRCGAQTQNVMAICDFNMCFTFFMVGWEGSAHHSRVFKLDTEFAILEDDSMQIPPEALEYHVGRSIHEEFGSEDACTREREGASEMDNELEIFREVRGNDVPMWTTVIAFQITTDT
ncbi:uncharacterized protein LOC110037934 [Phalaenopsis equestris]|uniref:uncharacterized protein LOC110037934 n=1 Tax=Phalaenopsis equestris TaxID=78828 RepID=UPI0009E519C5|nr:uncharacterized protein LOC110037934 [Phalaenopsis equestris]